MKVYYFDTVTSVAPKPPLLIRTFQLLVVIQVMAVFVAALLVGYVVWLNTPPPSFPVGVRITIEEGSSLKSIAEQLSAAGYTRSKGLLYVALTSHELGTAKASVYRFGEPITTIELADRIMRGEFGIDLERFVHYEGERVTQIAARASEVLIDFDSERFIEIALPYEGRLFPDTYLIPENYTADELFALMNENYESRVGPLRPAIEQSNFTEQEVLILASILEREANSRSSKRIVSGILQQRLEIGMPLQADASIEYILDTPLNELAPGELAQNLRESDSPYNTYKNPGLPPTPIGNPGLDAIEAILEPEPSPYLFYITGRDGTFYYASNYTQHQINVSTYLR